MPVLGREELIELQLPSHTPDDPAKVTINGNILAGQAEDLWSAPEQVSATFELIAESIKSWTFTTSEGQPAEITAANVRKLSIKDFEYLSDKIVKQINLKASAQVVSESEKKA